MAAVMSPAMLLHVAYQGLVRIAIWRYRYAFFADITEIPSLPVSFALLVALTVAFLVALLASWQFPLAASPET